MKIAITADVHLGYKDDYPERYNALENIFQQMNEEKIGILFIAGDLFDREFSNYADFENLCSKYPGIQLHIIPGNHDSDINDKNIVGDNIHIYTSPNALEIETLINLLFKTGRGSPVKRGLREWDYTGAIAVWTKISTNIVGEKAVEILSREIIF